ncbi:MAG: hypothetical protein C0404_09435 [Verrucomicrobia bacterium]|nr:hypothetical protein [Verrucomicrobiota bacterium]
MKCEEVKEWLTPYLLGDLEDDSAAEIKAHIDNCAGCRAEAQEVQRTLDLLRDALAASSKAPKNLSEEQKKGIVVRAIVEKQRAKRSKFAGWFVDKHPVLSRWAAILFLTACLFGLMLPAVNTASLKRRPSSASFEVSMTKPAPQYSVGGSDDSSMSLRMGEIVNGVPAAETSSREVNEDGIIADASETHSDRALRSRYGLVSHVKRSDEVGALNTVGQADHKSAESFKTPKADTAVRRETADKVDDTYWTLEASSTGLDNRKAQASKPADETAVAGKLYSNRTKGGREAGGTVYAAGSVGSMAAPEPALEQQIVAKKGGGQQGASATQSKRSAADPFADSVGNSAEVDLGWTDQSKAKDAPSPIATKSPATAKGVAPQKPAGPLAKNAPTDVDWREDSMPFFKTPPANGTSLKGAWTPSKEAIDKLVREKDSDDDGISDHDELAPGRAVLKEKGESSGMLQSKIVRAGGKDKEIGVAGDARGSADYQTRQDGRFESAQEYSLGSRMREPGLDDKKISQSTKADSRTVAGVVSADGLYDGTGESREDLSCDLDLSISGSEGKQKSLEKREPAGRSYGPAGGKRGDVAAAKSLAPAPSAPPPPVLTPKVPGEPAAEQLALKPPLHALSPVRPSEEKRRGEELKEMAKQMAKWGDTDEKTVLDNLRANESKPAPVVRPARPVAEAMPAGEGGEKNEITSVNAVGYTKVKAAELNKGMRELRKVGEEKPAEVPEAVAQKNTEITILKEDLETKRADIETLKKELDRVRNRLEESPNGASEIMMRKAPAAQEQERSVASKGFSGSQKDTASGKADDGKSREAVIAKMKNIKIPNIEYRNANLNDVLADLQELSVENDPAAKKEARGVSVVMDIGAAPTAAAPEAEGQVTGAVAAETPAADIPQISFRASQISVYDALKVIADNAGLKIKTDENGRVKLVRAEAPEEDLVLRTYDVGPGFQSEVMKLAQNMNLGAATTTNCLPLVLHQEGVTQPRGASLEYNQSVGKLIVQNTPENLTAIEGVLANLKKLTAEASKTVEVATVPRFKAWGVNPFIETQTQPFSTFSISVDTASYTVMRNYILKGELPPAESVRTEEFVNYFDYAYTAPQHETFRIYTECAPSKFGHGVYMLKVGVKGKRLGREEQRQAVLTILVDTSGSMDKPDRMGLVKKSLKLMVEKMNPRDVISIVQYNDHARLVLDGVSVSEQKKIIEAIDGLQCNGSTNLEEGMEKAYEVAARGFVSKSENRVILMSDGVANLGSSASEDILKKVEVYRKQGIFCSVLGFGIGTYNDIMLQGLASKGDGTYVFIDSEAEAKRALVDDMAATLNTIAKDVKIQMEFNVSNVAKYRQIGYESRQLKKEDFRNDSVDAGEVGSGQSVTALYEMDLDSVRRHAQAQKVDDPVVATVRVRYRRVDNDKVEEIEKPVRMSEVKNSFDAMTPRFKLAACAAHYSEILRVSPFAEGSSYEDVAKVLRPVAMELNLDGRVSEFLRLVESARSAVNK